MKKSKPFYEGSSRRRRNQLSLLKEFFRFVIKKGREEFMIFIAMSYQTYYREKQRIVVGKDHVCPMPLKEDTISKIRQLVDKKFDATIELTTKVEPDIIGGFIFEVDNYLMDSSVKNSTSTYSKRIDARLNAFHIK